MGFPNISQLLLSVPAVLWAITFHEFCHGYVAYRLGDPTAKMQGRLTLNPLAHLDPIGALMLLIFRFGWAKPVPVNSRHFKNPKRDMLFVSLAGVTGNILTAIAVGLLIRVAPGLVTANTAVFQFLLIMIFMNLGLAFFNLLPIPPLDGSKVLYAVLPAKTLHIYFWLERYGMWVLLGLVFFGVIQAILGPLVRLGALLILPGWMGW
ncbi:MAG: site-2 protease family protein [Synergistales bacterium]|nr:site-2 protease family protein [Synergistales bacterium]